MKKNLKLLIISGCFYIGEAHSQHVQSNSLAMTKVPFAKKMSQAGDSATEPALFYNGLYGTIQMPTYHLKKI